MSEIEKPTNIEEKEAAPNLEVVPRNVLIKKIGQLHEKPNFAVGLLLSGDRISCCDEGVIMEKEAKLVGVATIAPEGEEHSGQPTIVGLYVAPEYRGQGYGDQILRRAIERCIERGFDKIRMDVMSSNVSKILEKLPDEMKEKIDVHNLGNIMEIFNMSDKEKFTPRVEQESDLHTLAEQARNPYQAQLKELANEYSEKLRALLPEGSIVDLGGSLNSNTALRGHNDIDLRILLPEEYATEERIREISRAIDCVVPFQKVRPVGSPGNKKFVVMHQLEFEKEGIEGGIEIETNVRPAEGYIGFAKFQSTFPQELLDEYVLFKDKTKEDKKQYKKVKEQFYAMTRWLYSQEYWDEIGKIVGKSEVLEEAKKMFWGDKLENVISKPQPEI